MKKVRLTRESCKKDLMLGLKTEMRYLMVCGAFLLITLAISIAPLALFSVSDPSGKWLTPWILGLWALFPAYAIFVLCRWHLGKKWIQTVELSVTEAKLSNIVEDEIRVRTNMQYGRLPEAHHYRLPRANRYHHIDHHVFYFSSYGRYVPPIRNFDWSEYAMSAKGLSDCSLIGDTFYLFTYMTKKKREKIAFAYPAKYFEWSESSARN